MVDKGRAQPSQAAAPAEGDEVAAAVVPESGPAGQDAVATDVASAAPDVAADGKEGAVDEEGKGSAAAPEATPTKKKVSKNNAFVVQAELRAAQRQQMSSFNRAAKEETDAAMKDRMKYLLSQSKIFEHFMNKPKVDLGDVKTGTKRRMTEKEEDEILLKTERGEDDEAGTTRLSVQPPNITGVMRPYQVEGLNFLIGLYERGINGILADEMGLGKTLQTISMFAYLKHFRQVSGPHLVIAPKSTLGNWIREVNRWCPDLRAVKLIGSQEDRKAIIETQMKAEKFDVLVTSYEMVIKEKSAVSQFFWRYLVIDEAHRIKNEQSILSQVVRVFSSQNRLLITGTPLQNNLHELWALLNFLLPDVFANADDFDAWFASVDGDEGNAATGQVKDEIVQQLHAVLKPFLIRRLKSDVATDLPPKTETVLFTKLAPLQLNLYRNLLKKDIDAINGTGGDRVRLLNILMQLRKCSNHPYLFDGVEDRALDPFGDHLVTNCGKLALLDKLLPRLRANGHRVLIFCQMTRVLDILEDYCCPQMRNFPYCRIDGSTDGDLRDAQIEEFNRPDSEKFIFLLSTRAGGLGINLATADTVIMYDSDWNPQVDLQAMDRAHRIGQRKPVKVFRLVTENSVEERILKKAMQKLRLDTIVIQQGRLADQKKNLGKDEVLDMIRYGADTFFKTQTDDGTYGEEEIDSILERGAAKTAEWNEELGKLDQNALNLAQFKLGEIDAPKSIYDFEGGSPNSAAGKRAGLVLLDVGKRERRGNQYDEPPPGFVRAPRAPNKPKQRIKIPREPVYQDFQFFNGERLKELWEKEKSVIEQYNLDAELAAKKTVRPPEPPVVEEILTPEEQEERAALLEEGMPNWNRREFHIFLRGCERNGRHNLAAIAEEIGESKTLDEVKAYSQAFWTRGPACLDNWAKIKRSIEEGEAKIVRREELELACARKCERYEDPWRDLEVVYAGNRGKAFTEDEDRWLICQTWKLGYGRWEELKLETRKAWQFRYDWYIKSRTPLELKRRVDLLIRAVEKENEELLELEKQSEKRRRAGRKGAEKRKEKEREAAAAAAAAAAAGNGATGSEAGDLPEGSPASKKRKVDADSTL